MPNRYQLSKARQIAKYVIREGRNTKQATSPWQLSQIVAQMSNDEWRTVCFAAGVTVADLDCKAAVMHMLRKRHLHVIGKKEAA